jgi:hypothetical protein
MRKKYPERHFVSHIAEHVVGTFIVLGIAVGATYLTNGAFAQTLSTPVIGSALSTTDSSLTLSTQNLTEEVTPVSFAVTVAPITDCSGSQPMTPVLFAISPLSGGIFTVTSHLGISDMKLSWGEHPLPNGVYMWRGIPNSGFAGSDGDSGTFELKGECGGTSATVEREISVTSEGTGSVNVAPDSDTSTGAVVEIVPLHSSSFVPIILSRPALKIFSDNVPVTSAQIFDDEEIEFRVEEAAAKKITLVAHAKETGKTTQIGNAVVDDLLSTRSTDIWVYFWNVENVPEGPYTMSAHVLRSDGTTIDTLPVSITIEHGEELVSIDDNYDHDEDAAVTTSLSVTLSEKEDILLRVNEPSACMNSLECMTFCESEADSVCASYAQSVVYTEEESTHSFADGVTVERILLMLSDPKRRPQELPELVTNAEEFFDYCAELSNEEVCIKALVRNDLATEESLEEKKAALMREAEGEEQIWSERIGAREFIDSDMDGITDYDEINIYRTDPVDEDTDHDGFVDSEEILVRTNPNGDSDDLHLRTVEGDGSAPDEEVQLENPLISGTTDSTLLAVASVSALAVGTDDEGNATVKTLRLAGVSPPNSFVTLFVYSDPIVVTVKADATGAWTYTLDRELPDGTHHVISAITDGGGRILAKSVPLPFVKQAAAVTAGETLPVNPGAPTFFSGASLYGIIAIVIALLGVSFSVLGLAVHKKEADLTIHHSA